LSAFRVQLPSTRSLTAAIAAVRPLLSPRAFSIGRGARPGTLSLESNSVGLIAAKLTTMGAGFVYWLVAAHLFTRTDVGAAAGVVAALMLCTQIAVLGIGSSVITEFRHHEEQPDRLVNSAMTLVTVTATVAAAVFLVLAFTVLPKLGDAVSSLTFALVFLVASLTATGLLLADQISAAMRRGDYAFARALVFGAGTLACLAAAAATHRDGALAIFAPWAVAGLVATLLGIQQLRRGLPGYRPLPVLRRAELGGLLRMGVPNHILTLSERVPGLVMPIFVAEIVSPKANAAWYAAWMMAWLAYMIPIQTGIATFAEVARDPARLPEVVGRALRTSLTLGCTVAILLIVLAAPLLSLLGSSYAADGAMPLRVLAVGIVPVTFTYAYFAACRGLCMPQRALPLGWAGVALVIAATVPALALGGLTAMAIAFVGVQAVVGAVAARRLHRLRARESAAVVASAVRPTCTPPANAY
jgi:O-antigen/teichoic acid export membrane protein